MKTFTPYLKLCFLLFFLSCFTTNDGLSTHIIGGYFSYEANANKANNFDIKLTLIRDELSGGSLFDKYINIQIFTFGRNGNFEHVETLSSITLESDREQVTKHFKNHKIEIEYGTYQFNYDIPDPSQLYYFVYQRCCMDSMIQNLDLDTPTGLSFVGHMTRASINMQNNSFQLNNRPEIFAVKNYKSKIYIDINDKEDDLIIIEFDKLLKGAGPFNGGSRPGDAHSCEGINPDGPCPPPYNQIDYAQFDALYKWADLKMDYSKYTFEGTPREESFNIYAIKVNEYRNGVLLGSNLIYLPLWVVDDWPIATDDTYKGSFKLYPNPTDHTINIEAEDEIKSVLVYTSNGELILQEDPQTDNYQMTLDQPSGAYFVHVIFADGVKIEIIIIN